jgi:hypothetical protein
MRLTHAARTQRSETATVAVGVTLNPGPEL